MPLHCSKSTKSSRKQLLIRKRKKKVKSHSIRKPFAPGTGKLFFFSFLFFLFCKTMNQGKSCLSDEAEEGNDDNRFWQHFLLTYGIPATSNRSQSQSQVHRSGRPFFVSTLRRASFKITLCWRTAFPFTNHQLEDTACIM